MNVNDLLLVTDVQNGFISEKTKHVLPRLESLLRSGRFQHIVFSQFENLDSSPYEKLLGWYKLKSADDQAIVSALLPFAKMVLRKSVYSAVNPWLRKFLLESKITTVYLAGIDTDCCVLASAVDIFQIGIRPVVLSEYCASNGGLVSHKAALQVLTRLIGKGQIISNFQTEENYHSRSI